MEAKYTRSILDINNGSIVRLIDAEMQKLMVNLFDEGTDDKARTLNVKLTFTPKNDKKEMSVKPVITSKLSPKKSEEIHLFNQVQYDQETGEVTGFRLQEFTGVVPGQLNLSGEISEPVQPVCIEIKNKEG